MHDVAPVTVRVTRHTASLWCECDSVVLDALGERLEMLGKLLGLGFALEIWP